MAAQPHGRPSAARATLRDVAADAAVSRATASLVLRNSPLVAPETRERVLASMNRLGYVYHRAAASLRTRRSHTVALVVNDITNPFFAELTMGVEARLDDAGYALLLANTADDLTKQDRLLATVREYSADGVLVCPAQGTPPEAIAGLARRHVPAVLVVRYLPDLMVDYAGVDNVAGAELAVEHLIAHGHRRIAFVGGVPASSARRDRVRGYANALARHGLAYDAALLAASPPTRDGGRAAVLSLLDRPVPPTAVLCYNDVVAFGAMLGVQAAGRSVGDDVAVVGFDDIAEAALWHPALTTLSVAPRRIGAEAAGLLLQRLQQPAIQPRRVILAPTLIVRASCGTHSYQEDL